MRRLFLDGPAHGQVIDIFDPEPFTWVVPYVCIDASPAATDVVQHSHCVYTFGSYLLPRKYPWDPARYISVATPNGEEPSMSGVHIARLAHEVGFRDTDGRPV